MYLLLHIRKDGFYEGGLMIGEEDADVMPPSAQEPIKLVAPGVDFTASIGGGALVVAMPELEAA
jgi:hypothetical protein